MMKAKSSTYTITSKVFLWSGDMAAWHFFGVPKKESTEIKEIFGQQRRGFGSIPVSVSIGKSHWQTSIFPDSKSGTYLLPLKSKVRQAEGIFEGDRVKFTLEFSRSRLKKV